MWRKGSSKELSEWFSSVIHKMTNKAPKKLSRKVAINMNIKLWGSFIFILLLLSSISIVSYNKINVLSDDVLYIGKTQVREIQLIGDLKEKVIQIRLNATKHAYEQSDDDKAKLEKVVNEDIVIVRKKIKEIDKKLSSDKNNQLFKEFDKEFENFAHVIPSFLKKSSSNDYYTTHGSLGVLAYQGDMTIDALDKVSKNVQKDTNGIINQAEKDSTRSFIQIIVVSVVAILFSILIAFFITRLIRLAVNRVVNNVDSTTKSVTEIKKSIDKTSFSAQELGASMNKANDSVSELVASIQQVAGNTNVTASGVDEISAAVEQMSASINL
ncbi:MCP four helix bundle domain-containing protein, partial [Neobacillus sp.]|uniref:MCP four helix bundle domain-containing protein n=1 Tax=Neobacillus sp. TaxID=2675273 RepID=UPI00289F22CD